MRPHDYLALAISLAYGKRTRARSAGAGNKYQGQFLVAIGVRADGATVMASNSTGNIYQSPETHAEIRLIRKLDRRAVVYIARTNASGKWAMAKPCSNCLRSLKRTGVKTIYYTIAPNEYGVIRS